MVVLCSGNAGPTILTLVILASSYIQCPIMTMNLIYLMLTIAASVYASEAPRYVFAHFIVSTSRVNTLSNEANRCRSEMLLH